LCMNYGPVFLVVCESTGGYGGTGVRRSVRREVTTSEGIDRPIQMDIVLPVLEVEVGDGIATGMR
jgi:hypothetical protein